MRGWPACHKFSPSLASPDSAGGGCDDWCIQTASPALSTCSWLDQFRLPIRTPYIVAGMRTSQHGVQCLGIRDMHWNEKQISSVRNSRGRNLVESQLGPAVSVHAGLLLNMSGVKEMLETSIQRSCFVTVKDSMVTLPSCLVSCSLVWGARHQTPDA